MAKVKIFNTLSTASSTTKNLIHIKNDHDGSVESRIFPAGHFMIKSEAVADPATDHGYILIESNDGRIEMKFESSDIQDKDGNEFGNQEEAIEYLNGFFFELNSGSGGGSLPSDTNEITVSTSDPSGGDNGDLWIKVSA